MRLTSRICLAFLVLSVWGCAQKGAKLQKSVVPPDKTLFETGSEYLKKSQYIKARLAFQTLISTYPDSDMAADSYLAVGDSFYNEGGTENLLQAEDQYKNFIVFFPTHPKAADAQMKIVSLNMKMMRSPDRDQQYSIKAEQAIEKFLEQFPDNDYTPIVKQYQKEVQENLAQGDFGVGQFYADRGNFFGAKSRYKDIVDKYPYFSQMDESLFRLAQSLEKSQNPDEAAIYYTKIAVGYPFSKRFQEAKDRLAGLGKPVPEVDTKLAEQNESNLKAADGFSPLRPFIMFAEAIGFKGPPDRYEFARKKVEEQKAEALAQASAPADAAKAGENTQIEAFLTKDASGKSTQTAVVGSNTNASTPVTDKDGNKKKETNKKKKPPKKNS